MVKGFSTAARTWFQSFFSKTVNLKLLTLNTRGQQDAKKRKKQLLHLKNYNADVIFLQETHSTSKSQVIYEAEWAGKSVVN